MVTTVMQYSTVIQMLKKTASDFQGLITNNSWLINAEEYSVEDDYAYFGKDFESYFRVAIDDYEKTEREITESFHITSKPGKAKAVAQHTVCTPTFITQLADQLGLIELMG